VPPPDHDLLAQLARHLREEGGVPLSWVVEHAPSGDLTRAWRRSEDPVALAYVALAAGHWEALRGLFAECELLLAEVLPSTRRKVSAWGRARLPAHDLVTAKDRMRLASGYVDKRDVERAVRQVELATVGRERVGAYIAAGIRARVPGPPPLDALIAAVGLRDAR
jgi:hypothetical protein